MMHKVTVLVTGVGGGGIGEQLIKALRLSERVTYTIVGTDTTKASKGAVETDIFSVVPAASHEDYISSLIAVCEEHHVQVVFPGSEPELKVLSRNREAFKSKGILLPVNPQSVIDICLDKAQTVDFLRENGFYYPSSVKVKSAADLEKVDFLPAVLKPSVGGSGSANIMIAQTKDELMVFGKYLLNIYDEYIIQEYVGVPDHEYTVGVLLSMEGKLINSIAVKRIITHGLGCKIKIKNRTDRKEWGDYLVISSGISQGEVGRYEEVTKVCEEIALKIGAQSAINIQCRFYNNKVYVFEINPRYSGTTPLRAMMGYNEPDVMVRKHILGEEITPFFDYKSGLILRGLNEVLVKGY